MSEFSLVGLYGLNELHCRIKPRIFEDKVI